MRCTALEMVALARIVKPAIRFDTARHPCVPICRSSAPCVGGSDGKVGASQLRAVQSGRGIVSGGWRRRSIGIARIRRRNSWIVPMGSWTARLTRPCIHSSRDGSTVRWALSTPSTRARGRSIDAPTTVCVGHCWTGGLRTSRFECAVIARPVSGAGRRVWY